MMRSRKKRCQVVMEVMIPNNHTESDIQQNIEAAAAIAGYNLCPGVGIDIYTHPPENLGPSWVMYPNWHPVGELRIEFKRRKSKHFQRRRAGRR